MFTWSRFKKSLGFIAAIVGIFCYVIAYWKLQPNELSYRILINIADVLVIGVVVGYLSSVAQWSGVFKKDIQDIIFGEQLLGERKDIDIIWRNVTKQLLKSKFAGIHKDLLNSIKDTLPDENSISYYEDYDADIVISWKDKDNNIIEVTEALSFTIVADSEKEFIYKAYTWSTISADDVNPEEIITNPVIKVDGAPIDVKYIDKKTNGCFGKESQIKLSGKKSYSINYECTKCYNLDQDNVIGLKAQFLIRNITVSLSFPESISATFIENGTNKDFETVKNHKNCIKKRLKGVVFSKQGYIFALNRVSD